MKTLLLTGNTYCLKRQIKRIGGIWNRDNKGWLVPFENYEEAKKISAGNNMLSSKKIYIEETEMKEEDCFKPITGEDLREYRQEKANRKIEKWKSMVETRKKKIEEIERNRPKHEKDYSFITEPLKPGHYSYNSHKKARERMRAREDKIYQLWREIEELESKIKYKSKVRIKGDADKERQKVREQNDEKINVGDKVNTIYGIVEVIKKNKKTFKVKTENGWETNMDKSLII